MCLLAPTLTRPLGARQGQGFDVDRGVQRWELERQVRLVAGSVVLTSVVGSVTIPRLKWLAAAIGAGLDLRRDIKHLRNGDGAVEVALQPGRGFRYENASGSTRYVGQCRLSDRPRALKSLLKKGFRNRSA